MRLVLAALLLPFAALAGCGPSEEAARNAIRERSIQDCLSAPQQQVHPVTAGLDLQRLCTCVTDKVMEGKSSRDLRQIRPGDPGQREAMAHCFAEIVDGGSRAAGGKPVG